MYAQFFGLKREPFSIAPDPRYLFMSERHREALAHLLYGVNGGGGFVLLTGEIGAGKTTVCRCFLEQIPKRCNVAYIFNPKLTVAELLKSICDEFRIPYCAAGQGGVATVKDYVDPLNEFLLRTHAVGQNNVLIIDEAQNLSADVLEQLRLLTNLETSERKLLQIVLIGQPELRSMLARPELEQLAQRVIARFHLDALSEAETAQYIRHRLNVAGLDKGRLFDSPAVRRVHQLARGVPRRINLLCDRALLGAYSQGKSRVDRSIVEKAASEVFEVPGPSVALPAGRGSRPRSADPMNWSAWTWGAVVGGAIFVLVSATMLAFQLGRSRGPQVQGRARLGAGSASGAASASTAATPTSAAAPVAREAPPDAALTLVLRDEKDAWRELARSWHLALGSGEPCAEAQRQQVLCFSSAGGLDLIRQLDRPGVLSLQDEQGLAAYAVLVGLSSQSATLRVGETEQVVSLPALSRRWRGEYATLWRVPPSYSGKLLAGHSGPAVDWLAQRLAQINHEPPPAGRQKVDAAMQARISAFQLAQGLKPDGVAGAATLMQINRATGVDEPRLLPQAPSRPPSRSPSGS